MPPTSTTTAPNYNLVETHLAVLRSRGGENMRGAVTSTISAGYPTLCQSADRRGATGSFSPELPKEKQRRALCLVLADKCVVIFLEETPPKKGQSTLTNAAKGTFPCPWWYVQVQYSTQALRQDRHTSYLDRRAPTGSFGSLPAFIWNPEACSSLS